MEMIVYCILDATNYPIAIYRDQANAYADLAKRNTGRPDVPNLCYMVRSKVLDMPKDWWHG